MEYIQFVRSFASGDSKVIAELIAVGRYGSPTTMDIYTQESTAAYPLNKYPHLFAPIESFTQYLQLPRSYSLQQQNYAAALTHISLDFARSYVEVRIARLFLKGTQGEETDPGFRGHSPAVGRGFGLGLTPPLRAGRPL